ncbi:MAG: NAD-dependent epimerase/dehydratase family protein [Thermoanaerobaculia bacterium]
MRILITGVSGFLGRHLASTLLTDGHEVFGLGLADGGTAGVVEEHVDVLDRSALQAAIRRIDPASVVHLAGLSHVGESWVRMPSYFAVNVMGAENVVAAAGDRQVILASSCEVYGAVPEDEQPIAEDRPPAPRNPYGLTKAAAERFVLGAGGLVVRMFNLVGPGQSSEFALPSFAAQLAAQCSEASATLSVGNLEARRDFVHVADAADAFVILLRDGARGEIYNLASGDPVSIEDALNELIQVADMAVTVRVDPARLRPVDVPLVCGTASNLEALGWTARRGRVQGLEDLWRATVSATTDAST